MRNDPILTTAEKQARRDGVTRRLHLAQMQSVIFAERPTRAQLLRLDYPEASRKIVLVVHRNQPFEYVASLLRPFAAYADLSVEAWIGDYDDSLNFDGAPKDAAAELIWLDFDRYRADSQQLADWLAGRIETRRAVTSAPILVAADPAPHAAAQAFNKALAKALSRLPAARVAPQDEISRLLGSEYWSSRLQNASGSRLSEPANVETARRLALNWLPSLLMPRIKAIAVDLDDTLYEGVLSEDGPAGVMLTPGHAALQRKLLLLKESGVFLILISQNELADVEALFTARADLPLRLTDFSCVAVNWGAKAAALTRAASDLRTGSDAVVFIDDNSGQIAQMAAILPETPSIVASADGEATRRALDYFPGLFVWNVDETDRLRLADLSANTARVSLIAGAIDDTAYLADLGVKLVYTLDSHADRERIFVLAQKTNQFNLCLERFDESEVMRRLNSPYHATVAFRLSDVLADSGVVGVVWARREGEMTVIDNICLSCRALGRKLESVMITTAIDGIVRKLGAQRIGFKFARGPRNQPALAWLASYAERELAGPEGCVWLEWDADRMHARHCDLPVVVEWKEPNA